MIALQAIALLLWTVLVFGLGALWAADYGLKVTCAEQRKPRVRRQPLASELGWREHA